MSNAEWSYVSVNILNTNAVVTANFTNTVGLSDIHFIPRTSVQNEISDFTRFYDGFYGTESGVGTTDVGTDIIPLRNIDAKATPIILTAQYNQARLAPFKIEIHVVKETESTIDYDFFATSFGTPLGFGNVTIRIDRLVKEDEIQDTLNTITAIAGANTLAGFDIVHRSTAAGTRVFDLFTAFLPV